MGSADTAATAAAAVCLLRMLRGMSSLSLLAVPCPEVGLLLFCLLVGEEPSHKCLARFSRTDFPFLEGLLAGAAAVAAVVVVVVVVIVVVVAVLVVMVAVVKFVLMVVAVAAEVTAVITDFESLLLLLHFRFLDRATTSDADVVVTFAIGFSI